MKNFYLKAGIFCYFLLPNFARASNTGGGGLPWEDMVVKFQKSLSFLGYSLCIIGIIWAGYGFVVQNEKEAGFKRLLGTLIGGTVIFGAQGILSTMVGGHF